MRSISKLGVFCVVIFGIGITASLWASPGTIKGIRPLPPFISSAATAGAELADSLGLRRPKEPDKAFIGSVGSLMRRCICIGDDTRYVWDVSDGLMKFAALRGKDLHVRQRVRESQASAERIEFAEISRWLSQRKPVLVTWSDAEDADSSLQAVMRDSEAVTALCVGYTKNPGQVLLILKGDGSDETVPLDWGNSHRNIAVTFAERKK